MATLVALKVLSSECVIVLSIKQKRKKEEKEKKKKSLKHTTFTVNIYKIMDVPMCGRILQIYLIVFHLEMW